MADDFTIKDFFTGLAVTVKAKLISAKLYPGHIIYDESGAEIFGKAADAKSNLSDGTAIGWTAIFKQVSFSIQAAAASLATLVTNFGAALTRGPGAIDSNTLRVALPTDQLDNTAHGATDAGIPAKIGFKAVAGLSGQTPVTAAQRTDALSGLDGAQYVRPHCGLEDIVSAVVLCTSGANTSAIAAQGAGLKFYLCAVLVTNVGGVASGNLSITDGTGGTEKVNVPFTTIGAVFPLPIPVGFTANTAVFVDPSGPDTIKVTLIGFKSKV